MQRTIRATVLALVVAIATSITAATASAATWTVWAGPDSAPPRGTPKSADLNAYFPSRLRVHVGDSVTFRSHSFHTATFLGRTRASQLPIVQPDPLHGTYSGINDSLGLPFWFDGMPKFSYNGAVFAPVGSTRVDLAHLHSSGILDAKLGYTFSFPRAGTYRYMCLVHGVLMRGRITVVPAARLVPTKAAVMAAAHAQMSAAFASARRLATYHAAANTVLVGVGGGGADLLAYLPATLTVKAGTTVSFVAHDPMEIHTVQFGTKAAVDAFLKATDLFPQGPGTADQVTPVDIYGTDPAPAGGAPYTYTGTNHGDGFFGTPALDMDPSTPFPPSARITFPTPGSFTYFCAIHGTMQAGRVIVTA